MHDEWLSKGKFIGKDQDLMNELTYKRATFAIARLKTHKLKCDSKYNSWFFYQYYFAQSHEFLCEEDRLSLLILRQ